MVEWLSLQTWTVEHWSTIAVTENFHVQTNSFVCGICAKKIYWVFLRAKYTENNEEDNREDETQPVEAPVTGMVHPHTDPDMMATMCKYLHDKKCIPITERKGSKTTLLNISVSTLLVLLD